MNQIKAFRILSTLSKEEFAEFDRFINSPFFNRSKDLTRLFYAVNKYYPMFKSPKLTNENIYKKLYPGKTFNEGTIRNLFTDLGNLAERFLGYVIYEGSSSYNYNVLLEMNHRDLPKLFLKHYEKSKNYENSILNEVGLQNLYNHLLDSELSEFNIRRSYEKDEPEMKSAENLLIYLIKFFLLKQSNIQSFSFNFNMVPEYNIVGEFLKRTDIEGLINVIEGNNPKEGKKLKMDYFMQCANENKNNNFLEYLNKVMVIFRSGEIEMSDREKFGVYASVSNIINSNMKSLDFELKKYLFNFKKEMVEKGITTEMFGKITAVDFITIVESAINVNEAAWARDYIESKIGFVDEDLKSDLYNYNMARVLFIEKKFEESNSYLAKVRQDSIYFKVDVKVNRLKNFYELNFLDAAFSQAEAFKQFLIRSEIISDKRHKSYSNFLKFYILLLKIKSGMMDDTEFVKKELEECPSMRSKGWLVKKFEELS